MSQILVRTLLADDVPEVQAMLAANGWPRRSHCGWEWAYDHNPARQGTDIPIGWVLTSGGAIVGCLGNVPHNYSWNGDILTAVTCSSFFVKEAWRGQSAALMRAFFLQKMPLHFSSSATALGAPFYKLFKARPNLDPEVDHALLWVASNHAFVKHALQRLGLSQPRWLTALGTVAVSFVRQFVRTGSVPRSTFEARIEVVERQHIDARFDIFWGKLRKQPGLHLDRSASTMRWRMGDPDLLEDLGLIVLETGKGDILGMAMVLAATNRSMMVPRVRVLDWCLLDECPVDASHTLLAGVAAWARARDLPLIEARRLTGRSGRLLESAHPKIRALEPGTHWAKASDSLLARSLEKTDFWSTTPIGGEVWINLADNVERSGRQPWVLT